MPQLQAAYERFGDRVAFVGVDTQDYPEAAGEFLEEVGVTYPQLADPDAELLGFTRIPGLPGHPAAGRRRRDRQPSHRRADEADIAELIQKVA